MNNFDFILIALFALFFIAALIRGLKHPATRFEGSFFAFLLAFFLAMIVEGLLYNNYGAYREFYSSFATKLAIDNFNALGPWILALAWLIAFFLPLYFLFRFFHRFANKRVYTLLLTLFAYLLAAYTLGLLTTGYLDRDAALEPLYAKSLLAPKLYPDNGTVLSFLYFFTGAFS